LQERLIFLIGSPRSGSTLLARMLGAHPDVFAPAEPHLLTPLANLGFYETVERAPYDPIISQDAIRELVARLPGGEADYLEALRAYTDRLYTGLLAPSGRSHLLDKTPAYALVLDFVARLYPNARYLVLTRHPLAIWTSYVESFFDGDFESAHRFNPILERYVPAIARFLREQKVPLHPVRYEELVSDPAEQGQRLCGFLGLAWQPRMVEYGSEAAASPPTSRGLGDPITVANETRPTTKSLAKWTQDLAGRPARIAQAERILASLLDEDLAAWGYPRSAIEAELAAIDPQAPHRRTAPLTRYRLERKVLVRLRRNIHQNAFGRLVRRIRRVCDVLLR
jgi:hypothetical protein